MANNGLDHLKSAGQPAAGKSKVGEKGKTPGRTGVKVKAAIFFDGTGNNQSNIKKRLKDSSYMSPAWYNVGEWKNKALGHFESYEQYYSNVATLYFMHKKKVAGERIASIYMEGIGTSNDGPDDTTGGAFGAGPTGIVDRVTLGIRRLSAEVKGLYGIKDRTEYLEELTVYAFGFSRGAAAARHFCARRADSRGRRNNLCQQLGVKPEVVTIKFVGLFDTVSSYDEMAYLEEVKVKVPLFGKFSLGKPSDAGVTGRLATHKFSDSRFKDDVPELHLNFDADPHVLKVVQLAAADEYRVNFSLTTISSAIKLGKGFEIRLPGAHSDIGGGYSAKVEEERYFGDYGNGYNFFRAAGYYTDGQIEDSKQTDYESGVVTHSLTGTRTLSNRYQYVALSIMLKLTALAHSGMQFGNPNKEDDERRPNESERNIRYTIMAGDPLFAIKSKLEQDALAQYQGQARAQTPPSPQPLPPYNPLPMPAYRWLRLHYLHLSWSDRTGFECRFDSQRRPARWIIAG